MGKSRRILAIIGRSLLIAIAVLFILFSISGIIGTWYVNRIATDVTLKVFSVVESGVSVADTGVDRALTKVIDSRSEIAQTKEDIETLGVNLKENHPALTALSERLDTRLAPTIDNIRSALEPVRDGLAGLDAVLSVANSLPYFQEKAPGLQDIQDSLENLSSLQADVQQLRTTIRAAAEGRSDELTDQTTTLLLNITQRVDDRLALTQSNLEELKSKVDDLKERIAQKKSELLFIINLIAVVATLLYLWLIYSQIVVIRVQVEKMRSPRKIEEKESSDEAPMVLDAPTVDMLSNQYRESLEPQTEAVASEPEPEATTGSEPESPPEA
jgi:peptidoglycan hydrolase CwlO-like protein